MSLVACGGGAGGSSSGRALVDGDTFTYVLGTDPGNPADLQPGCAFAPRCPLADARCATDDPVLVEGEGTRVACWHADVPAEVKSR